MHSIAARGEASRYVIWLTPAVLLDDSRTARPGPAETTCETPRRPGPATASLSHIGAPFRPNGESPRTRGKQMTEQKLTGSAAARHGSGEADLTIMIAAHDAFRRDLVS